MGGLYRAMATAGPRGDIAADSLASVLIRIAPGRYEDLDLIVGAAWPQSGAIAQNLCRVVGKLQAAKYVLSLVAVLGSPDVGVRVAAAVALGHLPGEHEGISALSLCLADEEPQVRAAACRSLGQLRATSACQSLLGATADPSPLVRAAAVAALVSLDNPVTLARMRAIIAEDPVPTVVVQAIAGLGRSALDQDLTMLMSLCTSEDHEVVKAAARALESFAAHRATASLLGLLEHDRWDVRWAAAEVLARREDTTAIGPLRRLSMREPDPTVRQAIAAALASLGAAS
jgi:HEAT repeat protein